MKNLLIELLVTFSMLIVVIAVWLGIMTAMLVILLLPWIPWILILILISILILG